MLISAAKTCLKIRIKKNRTKMKPVSNKKWFDKECRFKKHELRKISNQKHRDPLNANAREQCHDTLRAYKKLLNKKKKEYYNSKIEENAEVSDKKRFWDSLKSMDDTRKDKDDIPSISEDNWLTYFRSLHSKSHLGPIQQSIMNDLNYLELQKEQFPS